MNGMVIPGTPIAVDFWKISQAHQVRLFFLTHLHADHMEGLTSSWRFPIYTSDTNAALLNLKFKFAQGLVKSLEVGQTYQVPLDVEDENILSVTVLDANHIPGSVMFLFQGYFGNYLYCGDMRWYPELLHHPVLKTVVESKELDCVFLDNTFSASYCDFPSREEAKKEVFRIIDASPESEIKIGIRSLGKEALLEAVAARYQERILVSQMKYEILRVLKAPDVYTTDPKQARIHAVPLSNITSQSHAKWNEITPTVSLLLTALYVGWPHGPYSTSAARGLYVIPYSDHSSYSELHEMVACLAPRQVLPIVRQWSTKGWWSDAGAPDQSVKGDMSVYDRLLTKPPPDYFVIPKSVEKAMQEGSRSLYQPEVRQCRLRRGLMPRPKLAKTVPRGVVFSTPEKITDSPPYVNGTLVESSIFSPPHTSSTMFSPPHTNSTSIDCSFSMSSTPTHTFSPWKFCDTHFDNTDMKVNECNCISASPSKVTISSATQTLSCKLCKHSDATNQYVPSSRDCATQTPKQTRFSLKRKHQPEEPCFKHCKKKTFEVKEDQSLMKKMKYDSLVATEMLICEIQEDCKNNFNVIELVKKAEALCDSLCLLDSLI